MSTRSLIARKTAGGFEAVYCHSDGYTEHVLPVLTRHYATDAAVDELIGLGDMSSLGKPYEDDQHRAPPSPSELFATEEALIARAAKCWAEYIYVFIDGRWFYRKTSEGEWRVKSL